MYPFTSDYIKVTILRKLASCPDVLLRPYLSDLPILELLSKDLCLLFANYGQQDFVDVEHKHKAGCKPKCNNYIRQQINLKCAVLHRCKQHKCNS